MIASRAAAPLRLLAIPGLALASLALAVLGCGATGDSLASEQAAAAAPPPTPTQVYPVPRPALDSPWSAQVANVIVPIERFDGAGRPIDVARFQAEGKEPARVTVTLAGPQAADFVLDPQSIKPERLGNSLIFELPAGEHVRIVASLGGRPLAPLFVFRDAAGFSAFEPQSGRQRPIVYVDAPPPGTDAAHHTAQIQLLLDKAAANQGSALVMLPGLHPIQGLVFKNDVTLHFEPGAVWKADPDLKRWIRPTAEGEGGPVLLAMRGATNITLSGYGVIDGSYERLAGAPPILIDLRGAQNVRLQNLFLAGETTLRTEGARQVTLDHLRLVSGVAPVVPAASADVALTQLVVLRLP